MSLSNAAVVARFRDRRTGNGGNISTDGKRLLSYQACIALHVGTRTLIDGTRYSSTTSQHQSDVRRSADPTTSFPVLELAGLMRGAGFSGYNCDLLPGVEILDATRDYSERGLTEQGKPCPFEVPMGATVSTRQLSDPPGDLMEWVAHRPGGILFRRTEKPGEAEASYLPYTKATWQEHTAELDRRAYHKMFPTREPCDEYFLAAMDEGSYFVSQLPGPASTVSEAFETLKPGRVIVAEHYGVEVRRQGEWYFIPQDVKELGLEADADGGLLFPRWKSFTGFSQAAKRSTPLPRPSDSSNPHTATRLYTLPRPEGDRYFVSNSIRHPEHRRVSFPKNTVWEAVRNLSQGDWSAGRLGLGDWSAGRLGLGDWSAGRLGLGVD